MVISPTEGILIDGKDYCYLTSCHLTIRTVTNIVKCDGNDGNIQILHATSQPDMFASFCLQIGGCAIMAVMRNNTSSYHCAGDST